MILWRHRDPAENRWVYYSTRRSALDAVGRLARKHCAKSSQRVFFIEELDLHRVDISIVDGKQAVTKLMNRLAKGEQINEETILRGSARSTD